MIDTPRTDAAQAEDNGDPSHAFELCRELERERNEAREQSDKLSAAIRSFCTDFEAIKWGWDGDCGSARLADALFESLKGVAP
jgi:hypothetical protein